MNNYYIEFFKIDYKFNYLLPYLQLARTGAKAKSIIWLGKFCCPKGGGGGGGALALHKIDEMKNNKVNALI